MTGIAADKAHADAQLTQSTSRKRRTSFKFENLDEQLSEASPHRAAVLQSEGSFTQKVMQQMIYTGSFEDQNHLFLEVRMSVPALHVRLF